MKRKVDIWFGIGDGESRKLEGYLINHSETDYSTIQITDKEYLEEITFANDEDYTYNWATKLPQDKFVYYDDFCWSEIEDEELID